MFRVRGIPANDVKTSTKLRREAPPVCAWTRVRLAALAAVAALAGGLGLVVADTLHPRDQQVDFLRGALGATRSDAPLERRPAAGTVVELAPGGYRVRSAGITVGLRSDSGGSAGLDRFAHGASRRTDYGWEAVTVSPRRTEQYLTVLRRQGPKRWRWQLETLDVVPRVGADGAVAFIRDGRLLSELWLAPPRVLDENANDITPAGVRWALEQGREGWSLALDLDDSTLPLPYVIDPAIVARTPASSANTGGGASTITITKPAGLVAGDLVLAQITARGGTGVAVCPPTATGTWTSVDRRNSGTTLAQEVFRLSATAADVAAASYAFQIRSATCAGGLSAQKASGGIVAYVDTANQADPVDASNGAVFASAGTTTPPAVTPTVADTRIAAFYGAGSGGTIGSNWTGVTGELWDQSSTGGGAGTRTTSAAGNAAGPAAGTPFTPSTGDFVSSNAVSIGQTLALAPLAADGSGSLTTATTNVAAGSTGNTIAFTYTAATGGMRNGSVTLDVPAGWSAPSTTGTAAGYTTSSSGTVSVAGQTVTVSGLTLAAGSAVTITYGSTAGGGPGATAPATTGAQTWQAQQRSSSASGALTSLGASPSITVNGANGSGTLSVSPTDVAGASNGNTLTFTYTAAAGGMSDGAVRVTVPAGWSAPSTAGTAAGYTTADTGTVGVAGQEITVTGVTLAGSGTMTITYGSTAGGGPGATASGTTGGQTWQGAQRSVTGGTITNLGASPVVTVNAADGTGTLTTPATEVANGSTGNTFTFTYTAAAGGMTSGAVRVTVPAGWSAPSTTGTAAGYTTASTGTVGVAGQVITVTGVTLAGSGTMTITYGSTAGGGPGATATSAAGAQTWQSAQRSVGGSTITNLAASPSIDVLAADGTGTLTASPTSVVAGSTGTAVTLSYTAPAGGMSSGAVRVTVPAGWSAPSTSGTAAGYTAASTGTVGVAGQVITVTGVTLAASGTLTITYGSTADGGPGATAPTSTSAGATWQVEQRSSAGGTLTNLASSPSVTVNAGPLDNFLVEASSGGAIGTQTVGVPFAVRVIARDVYGNTVPAFDGAGSTVDVTSSGTLTAGSGTTAAFSNGVLASHSVTLGSTGATTITATRTSGGGETGTSASFTTQPGTLTNTAPVSITGTAQVGQSLSRSSASWSPGPDSRSYQWRRCDSAGASCSDIAGATGTDYTLAAADLGQTIRVVETATKAAYSDATSTSAQTAVVAAGTITNTAVPTISGTPTVSFTLTATGGSWTPGGTTSAFQWVRCNADGTGCGDLAGQTATTYVVVSADIGKRLKARETAAKPAYVDASADAALTTVVSDADTTPPTNTITLASAAGAFLSGTTLYYRPSAAGSFTLSSAVADSGVGPASASYPAVTETGWTHGAETISAPAGGPYVSSAYSWTGSASGSFSHVVTAADAWTPPNTSQTTLTLTEDSTAPATSAQCDAAACSAGWYTSAPVSVTLSASDGGAGVDLVRYTTDGTDPTLFNGSTYMGAISVAAEGQTTVKFRAYDRVGNTESVQSQLVRIDTVAPETTIDSGPTGSTSATGAAFTFSSNDGGAIFQCRLLPGGSWSACSSPQSYSSLTENTYTFEVRATDVAGNGDSSPAARTWTVDTTPADTTITSAPPADTNATGATFTFTASDAGPTFECKLDGGSFGACGSPKSYAGLAEGAHTFSVRAVDAAGNADPTPATYGWTVDTTPPDTTIPVTPADPSANTTPTFGLASSQTPATYACNLDGGGWSACSTPHTVAPALADGSHTLQVRATDAAGNTDATPAGFTWLVDATAPTGALTAPPDGSAVSGTVVVGSNSADVGGSGVMHALFERSPAGAGSWSTIGAADMTAPYSVGLDTTVLADGDYDLRVTTRDNAGNPTVSALRTVEVDNTAPSLSASAPNPVNLATADPATITASATDDGTGVASVAFEQCNETSVACDSDTWTSLGVDTTSPYSATWPLPADGRRLLRVRATDNAGRQRTQLILTTVDRTGPSGTVTAPTAGAEVSGTAAVAATASDPAPGGVASVDLQITAAGAPFTDPPFASLGGPSYDASLDTTAYPDGLYDLRAFVNDANGNSSGSARVTVRIDNTAPTGSITAPAGGANLRGPVALTSDSTDPVVGGSASGVASVQFQRSPAGAGTWTNQGSPWDTTLVADGQYDLRVVTTDEAGNSFTSAVVTVRVDNTAPTGTVTAPASGANVRTTVALASNSADGGSGVATVQFQRSPAGAGTWTNQASPWNTTLQPDGQYDLRVVTVDNAGNTFTSAAVTVRVDNTAPTGGITAPAAGAEIGVPPVTLTSDSADGGSGVDTVVFERRPAGGGPWTATPATWDTAAGADAVADGSYDLRVTTTDRAGNAFTSGSVTVLVDHTAPATSASLSPASPSNAPVTVTFAAGDGAGSGVAQTAYRVDGGSTILGSSVVIAAPGDNSNDGSHVVEFFSTDDVGNIEATKSVTVVIDTSAPSGSAGDPGSYLRGIAQLAYTTSDTDVSSVQFQFSPAGAGAWAAIGGADVTPPYEASWNTSLVADGAYDLRARVVDTAGNVANVLLPGLPKYVDNTAPAGAVTSPGAGAFVSGSVDVTATGSDGASPPASGVSAVRFEVKPAGAGSFTAFGTETAPVAGSTYRRSLDTTTYADGPAEVRVVVTDVAGNETSSATRTVTIDNLAPTVALADPGPAIAGTPTLSSTAAADTVSVAFERRPAGAGAWIAIGTDATPADGFTAALPTNGLSDGMYELRARAVDGGGNSGTSAVRSTRVDNELPTGSLTSPGPGAVVGGSSVALVATAADTGSGVGTVAFSVKPQGAPTYSIISTDSSAPYTATWDATSAPDGTAELRLVITDVAGNQRLSAVVPVTVDSTGPSVTLDDPGATLSGTVSLTTSTGGGAARVVFGLSPAGAGSWTEVGEDVSAPFAVGLDTTASADGLYDLRAIGYDALGNPSAPAIRSGIRFDNTLPRLVTSDPQDGSVSSAANQIVLTASEPVVATGVLLDGGPAPAPSVSGSTVTFSTGPLTDGLHVLSGRLQDASGGSAPFRVAVTVESTPADDRPPVEKSASRNQTTLATAAGSLAMVAVPPAAWPEPASAEDFLVVRVDPSPALAAFAPSLSPGSQLIEVTARWALAGTEVTEFPAPIEITIPNPSGSPVVPSLSQNGTSWRSLPLLAGTTLPAGQRDGFYRDSAGVHVVTRHLTYFALLNDREPPTPPQNVAGVVADDGLTLRWTPGSDNSGQLGQVVLYVNGESFDAFDPTQFETKLGPFEADDSRRFTLVQLDAAGNRSEQSQVLRAVPDVAGLGVEAARTLLEARGFRVGRVDYTPAPRLAPGTVLGPTGITMAVESTPIDLVVSGAAPQTRFVFQVASAKKVLLRPRITLAARVKVTRPATVAATLSSPGGRRLQTWVRSVRAGVTILRLPMSRPLRAAGTYRLVWLARSGKETIRTSVRFQLVRSQRAWLTPQPRKVDVVFAGKHPVRPALRPALRSTRARLLARTSRPDETFALAASPRSNVRVIVVDVDDYGLRLVRELRTVFPRIGLIAISADSATRARAARVGVAFALPPSTPATQLARSIARLAR